MSTYRNKAMISNVVTEKAVNAGRVHYSRPIDGVTPLPKTRKPVKRVLLVLEPIERDAWRK